MVRAVDMLDWKCVSGKFVSAVAFPSVNDILLVVFNDENYNG